jgi:maltose alpha-D-glucosyltransferase/alpha-amylase
MSGADPLWYKDAVFYELHVKAFQDSDGDGIGDFRGLIDRLDYVQDLGVDVIWLLPFYPSPLRDDGYDIADYYGINPQYGTVDDYQAFLDEAHRRGLKVIADLVLNHTSDQHPWFQRARRAPRGSPERDHYVWSDTDQRYPEARIIFTDTEPSNWTWDPVAEQYYWHRFFSHQPDLNWDNPEVKEKMFQIMEFWLDRGMDGFRCDAVPYLIERDGTICENLDDTHDILKEFRVRLDQRYTDRILLAEANQWPDDVRPYFGDGNEFQMAFHFPLMPRIFMAVRQGIRRPIVEIIERTPPIPDDCQWCMFLRNHDELTLEMVTDEERDYMYREYAADPRMRLNLGIRRRLAPLMENDRRKIELLNSILFTMPGSPIIYYGDEIAMGDNIYLGDRDGVRTPMQWSSDRNAGFSRAEASRLYMPVVMDSLYGFQSINVEAQQKSPFSLLNWMKRLIQVRKQHRAFGRGSIEFLEPANPHVLGYLREYEGDVILVVNNLSGTAQPVQLDLARFAGRTPVEMLGHTEFLRIDDTPYALTLSPYGFFWFSLTAARSAVPVDDGPGMPEWDEADAALCEEPGSVARVVSAIPDEWLARQRWFRAKGREVASVELRDHALIRPADGPPAILAIVGVRYQEGEPEDYLLPLTVRPPSPHAEAALAVSQEGREIRLYEALSDADVALALLETISAEATLQSSTGEFIGVRTQSFKLVDGGEMAVRPIAAEQSNTSIVFGDRIILKVFRKMEPGIHPDIEVTRFLTERTEFRALPALAGSVEYRAGDGSTASAAALFEFIPNSGDGWGFTLKNLDRFFAAAGRSAADPLAPLGRVSLRRMAAEYLDAARKLGRMTGEMHVALASAEAADPFAPEPISEADVQHWIESFQNDVTNVLGDAGRRLDAIPGAFSPQVVHDLAAVVREMPNLRQLGEDLRILLDGDTVKIRFHGDFHLGQTLRGSGGERDGEWIVLDFEGEPARPLAERRLKHSPLRDVAGMLRSFDYALRMAFREQDTSNLLVRASLERWAHSWREEVRAAFLTAYGEATSGARFIPANAGEFARVLAVFELEKAVYELGYEMNNRPDWIWIPIEGIRGIVQIP